MNRRGVSEVIAFVLIFSIVITSVGLLYTAGFGSLTQIQESETDRSAQRAFGASATALEDIQRGRGSHRAFDLELSGRTLAIDGSAALEIDINGSDTATAGGALVYGPGADTEIAYQSGAVIRSDGADAQLVTRPPLFQCSDDHAVISLVSIDGPNRSVSTDGSIQILADGPLPSESTIAEVATGTGSTVSIDYGGTPYQAAWESYFSDRPQWQPTGTPSTVECIADAVYVRHMTIELEYQGV